MKKIIWIIIGLLVAGFAVYILLDTFVIEQPYMPAPADVSDQAVDPDGEAPSEGDAEAVETPTAQITENSYEDDNISITLTHHREYDTNIHVAEVKISSPEYLKTAFAKGVFGQNIKDETSDIAESVNAIFAVNGDYYGAREEGYVVRNGVLYRDSSAGEEDLVIYKDGSLSMVVEGDVSADQLVEDGAQQVLSFGPALITNGEIAVPDKSKTTNPRTAVGQIDELHYLFVVTDGRVDDSEGLTYHQLAEFMQSLGAVEAYNLDGGGSSAMYFNGRTVNDTPKGDERRVSDIVYIGY